jgi:23S rRNA (cytidine1920-2'-O)/16S rRNA (cytidine1409-2'-O)-methyltransferase
MRPGSFVIALIKPQFEAGQSDVGKGGIVRDPDVHRRVLREIIEFAASIGLPLRGLTRSPITGAAGNSEFLAWLGGPGNAIEQDTAIAEVLRRPVPAAGTTEM